MELLTPEETAALLRVTPRAIYEMCRRRTQVKSPHPLPHLKLHGKALRFRRADIEAWLNQVAVQSSTAKAGVQ
jgi:excisionase family DNA binding protein